MNKGINELNNPLIRGLVAAALNPGLRTVLVFDAAIATLKSAANQLQSMLHQVTGCKVVTVYLGAIDTEEDLWGHFWLSNEKIIWRSGALSSGREQEMRLVVIPDLTRLSMAASRACIALMGSDIAYMERHGKQDVWQPNLCWLAGCPSKNGETGLISPHLLDRFALRLSEESSNVTIAPSTRIEAIRNEMAEYTDKTADLSPELTERLQEAKRVSPRITLESQRRIIDYFAISQTHSVRRELALLRLAKVNAQLEGAERVRQSHVDLAAKTIGLKLVQISEKDDPSSNTLDRNNSEESPTASASSTANESNDASGTSSLKEPESKPLPETIHPPDTEDNFADRELPIQVGDPYREDKAPVQREAASLRSPFHRQRNRGRGRGEIIGVEPATKLDDIAIAGTLFEAAKYQNIRRRNHVGDIRDRLIVKPTDLRRYRRAIVPEQMLAMVVDYTSLRECAWQEALLPYLQWAYTERANVGLIQVGADSSQNELQAREIKAKKVIEPQISKALEAGWGRATPLAHGLHLALNTLRHDLQHGRSRLERVVLVVITDGRGNVPLKMSQGGDLIFPVGQQGIEDALEVAEQISRLKGVKAVVLNPQPKHYSDLPIKLALALGAKIAEIPPVINVEVED